MIYLPLKHLRPGMILARSIDFDLSILPLVAADQPISSAMLSRLQELNIPGVYIKSSFGNDIEVNDFIDPQLKHEVTLELKSLCTEYIHRTPVSSLVQSMTAMAGKLMDFVLSKDEHLVNVIDIKDYDTYTYSHSIYVSILCILIGLQLGCSKSTLIELSMSGLMHDLGKLDLPISIINKNGPLTPEEFQQIQTHPGNAIQRLGTSTQTPYTVLRGIESHHEKFNGTGYPHGLSGENIPLYGRIVAVADVYDALTSARPYRRAWYSNEAIEYMMGCAGSHFDYDILQIFLKTIAAYPVGTLVELSNGYIGAVIQNSPNNTLRPVVRVLLPKEHKGEEINLADNRSYLNVTILGTLNESTDLPNFIFE